MWELKYGNNLNTVLGNLNNVKFEQLYINNKFKNFVYFYVFLSFELGLFLLHA